MAMINAYYILSDVRDNLHEASESHWDDAEILRKINQAQMELAMHLAMSPGSWLVKRATVTPSSGEISLPSDCAKPLSLEEVSTGTKIPIRISVSDRAWTRQTSLSIDQVLDAYMLRDKIVVNNSSYSNSCYLWYHIRVPDLHAGTAGAGSGASALVLDADNEPRFTDDYYNGVTVEVIDQTSGIIDISSTVSDYVGSTTTMTITGTPASGDYYGTISLLPDEAYIVLMLKATLKLLSKPSAVIDDKYYERFKNEQREAWLTYKQFIASRANDQRYTRITELE